MIYIIIAFYIIFNIAFNLYEFDKRYISAGLLISLSQLIMFIGIFSIADFKNEADYLLINIYFFGYVLFAFTYLLLTKKYSYNDIKYNSLLDINNYQKNIMLLIIFTSIIISFAFFYFSGTNILKTIISAIFQGEFVDLSQSRKAINFTRGNGAVYQLRNFVIPLLVMYLIIFGKGRIRTIGIILFPVTILLLIGSGQRAGIIYLLIIIVSSVLFSNKLQKNSVSNYSFNKKINKRNYIIFIVLILIFIVMTILNGRDQVSGTLIKAILDRFIYDNQSCAILGFRYIYSQNITYGNDWFNMFLDLFRENQYIPVSSIIHAQLYGSIEGTSPPCIWGSAYYNFGFFGIIIVAIFLAVLSSCLYRFLINKKNNGLRLILIMGMEVLLSMWIADSPIMLLNGGFLTIAIMYFIFYPPIRLRI